MPARPYHIPCHVRQSIPYARQAITFTMSCPPGHTMYHAMSTQVIPYTMPCPPRPYQIPCHASQAIPQTMPFLPGHTIYHAMPAMVRVQNVSLPCHTKLTMYICRPFQYDCMSRWPYELVLVALRSVVVSLRCVLVTMERF